MKKKIFSVLLMMIMVFTLIVGCSSEEESTALVRVAGLKGPTSMGLLNLMEKNDKGEAKGQYEFSMMTAADEILPLMIKGELDVALIPANVASVLYNKTNGGISVIDINTLGVLYMVSGDAEIKTPADLVGKTIYLTGKGTTPDYVLHYILSANMIGEDEYTLEYKSEATEVAAVLASDPDAVGLLPQPFVTAACAQNDALNIVMDMNKEWANIQENEEHASSLVTGVTVVRNEFLQQNESSVKLFLSEHKDSVKAINEDTQHGASLAVEKGIVAKEGIAMKAIPNCNITYIDGKDMKQALEGYLQALAGQNIEAVGGKLPEEDFYYIP